MRFSTLRVPDLLPWRGHPEYSGDVAKALSKAYRVFEKSPRPREKFLDAYAYVLPVTHQSMSPQQRMHVDFLRAAAYTEGGDYDLAVEYLHRAEEIALNLNEEGARADLLYLRSGANHARLRFVRATDDCVDCLQLVRLPSEDPNTEDQGLEMDVLSRLASYEVMTANFDRAAEVSDEAHSLLSQPAIARVTPDSALGNLLLVRAHILRLRNEPELAIAFESAITAVGIYEAADLIPSLVRAQTLAADIALDRADSFAANRASIAFKGFLDFAGLYAERALSLAEVAGDAAGIGLALLSRARFHLLAGANEDTRSEIKYVMRLARELKDTALFAQALTALGSDMLGRGERESGLSVYRAALNRIRGSEVPMLEIIPRKALLRAH